MNQKLMIENLKELSSELWKHAAESESVTPAAWAESLDDAIETLERIRWRKVGEEFPECVTYRTEGGMSKWISVRDKMPEDSSPVLTVYSNVYGEMVLALNDYDSECDNPWHDSGREETLYWMPIPPIPKMKEEEDNE